MMIGDRSDDIRAARAHGVHAAAVRWGYGSPDELRDAAPDYFVETVDGLVTYTASAGSR